VRQARFQAEAVDKGLKLAFKADPALRDRLGPLLDAASSRLRDGLLYAESRVIQPQALDEKPAAWWAQMTQLIDTQYALADGLRDALALVMTRHADVVKLRLLAEFGGVMLLMMLCLWTIGSVGHQMTQAVDQAVQLAEAVAAGDLSRQVVVRGMDESARMLRALDGMARSLSATVSTVRDNASQVACASAQIAQGNLDLSNRTEQQASALQQTAASIEELGATVTHTADNARQANQLAGTAREVALRGGAAVGEMVATMKEIDVSSRRIGEIIGTIDGIAFQTNILALNAAVEAARAGEQGRGFAVVAGEVRSLAQRSAQAAKEIRTLIGASVERSERGSAQADRAGTTMNDIVTAIDRVSALMADINTATAEQSSGVHQVDQAMAEIDRATQQNAALVEESAAAADSLRHQAEALQQSMQGFRLAGAA
jgi:methyl-accepting chemotaxis protein